MGGYYKSGIKICYRALVLRVLWVLGAIASSPHKQVKANGCNHLAEKNVMIG